MDKNTLERILSTLLPERNEHLHQNGFYGILLSEEKMFFTQRYEKEAKERWKGRQPYLKQFA